MGKRGRPSKNGQCPRWMLIRDTLIVDQYDRARSAGEKHSEAVKEVVRGIKETHPQRPISETGVRRSLALRRPRDSPVGLVVGKPGPANSVITLDGRSYNVLLMAAFGARPVYPRHKASD